MGKHVVRYRAAGDGSRRAFAILGFIISFAVVTAAPPVNAHSGYHHGGPNAYAGVHRRGLQAQLQVTNPSVPADTTDHYASSIHMARGATAASTCANNGLSWIEIGWAEVSWKKTGSGANYRGIYTYHTSDCKWKFWSTSTKYNVVTGDRIVVRLQPKSTCNADVPCEWQAMLYWNGTWRTLATQQMPFDNIAKPDVVGELQNKGSGSHWGVATSASDEYANFYGVRVRTASGWTYWRGDEVSTCGEEKLPYPVWYYDYAHTAWQRNEDVYLYRFRQKLDTTATNQRTC